MWFMLIGILSKATSGESLPAQSAMKTGVHQTEKACPFRIGKGGSS
jgi:hypothetical protein